MSYSILRVSDNPYWVAHAAQWFSEKWGIQREVYTDSMRESISTKKPVPQWYIALDGDMIIGGMGVIENDFHPRTDLTPNVCAVYTEEAYRCQGIAGAMLETVCSDMHRYGIDTLYLLTDHTSFYERYGWTFHSMVRGNGENSLSRMYVHHYNPTADADKHAAKKL